MFTLGRGLGLSSFRRDWLVKDLVAGLVLTTLLVPQGMAYAELAGLPPITGLYTSILCLLGYAVFGPSRILVLGPDSSLGPMIAATILPLVAADGDPERAVALASMLAIMVAAIMILAAVAKLGFIADLISKPTMIGYMNGLALTILVGQLPKLFGFKVDGEGLIGEVVGFVEGLADGKAVAAAAAVGIAGIALILVLQRWLPKVPAVLVAVVLAIAATSVFDLAKHGVSLVGVLPKGFPPLTIPGIRLADLGPLLAGALGIALVSLADTISTASAFAARTGQEIHGNQEMIGIGAANLAAGLFQGFPVSTSGSRTAVAERSGAKTQLTGVTGAVLIILMIVFVPGLFRNLPQPALAAVVITASLSLADIPGTVRLWRQRKVEFMLSIAAFLGVALLGVLPGIGDRGRPVDPQRLPAGVVAVPDGARARGRPRGLPRRQLLPGRQPAAGPGDLPVRRAADLRQRQDVPRRGHAAGPGRPAAAVDPDRGGADDRRGHHRLRHPGRTGRNAERAGGSAWCSPSSRTRYGARSSVTGLPARSIRAISSPRSRRPSPRSAAETGADWTPAMWQARIRLARPPTTPPPGRDDDGRDDRGIGYHGNLQPRSPLDTARVSWTWPWLNGSTASRPRRNRARTPTFSTRTWTACP